MGSVVSSDQRSVKYSDWKVPKPRFFFGYLVYYVGPHGQSSPNMRNIVE
jgi:hypothetical protein